MCAGMARLPLPAQLLRNLPAPTFHPSLKGKALLPSSACPERTAAGGGRGGAPGRQGGRWAPLPPGSPPEALSKPTPRREKAPIPGGNRHGGWCGLPLRGQAFCSLDNLRHTPQGNGERRDPRPAGPRGQPGARAPLPAVPAPPHRAGMLGAPNMARSVELGEGAGAGRAPNTRVWGEKGAPWAGAGGGLGLWGREESVCVCVCPSRCSQGERASWAGPDCSWGAGRPPKRGAEVPTERTERP